MPSAINLDPAVSRQPATFLDGTEACAGVDPEVFYARNPEPAKKVCRRCPLKHRCRDWALETRQAFGVWGGLTAAARLRIHRQNRTATRGGTP